MFWARHPDEIARNPVLLAFLIFKAEGPGDPTSHTKGPRSTGDSPVKWSPRAFPRATVRAQELRVAEFPFTLFSNSGSFNVRLG